MSKQVIQSCPCGEGPVYIRGRCRTCYMRVYRLVQSGELTWRQAERRGIVLKSAGRRAEAGDRRHVTPETLGTPYAKR